MAGTEERLLVGVCKEHSGMLEFKRTVLDKIKDQDAAINGIKSAAWVSAISTIGTLISVILLLLSKVKLGP